MDLVHQENNMKKCSVLRDFVQTIDYNEALDNLKRESISHINKSSISSSDKRRMSIQITHLKNRDALIRYLFNAMLKFEGHGVI